MVHYTGGLNTERWSQKLYQSFFSLYLLAVIGSDNLKSLTKIFALIIYKLSLEDDR